MAGVHLAVSDCMQSVLGLAEMELILPIAALIALCSAFSS